MDEDLQQYSNKMEEMFSTQGWKELISDAKEAIEVRKERLLAAGSIDEVRFMQGEVAQLRVLENMQEIVRLRVLTANLETIDVDDEE